MQKNTSIQGLRGLFAIGVLLSHCFFLGEYAATQTAFNNFFSSLANVSFFFMLSGFFMVQTHRPETSFGTFLLKKLKRLWPLHILLIAGTALMHIHSGKPITIKYITQILTSSLMVQTWVPVIDIAAGINGVAWYLSSLMFSFIATFFLLRYVDRNEKRWKVLYVLTGILLAIKVICGCIFRNDGNFGYWLIYLCPLAGFTDFLIGMLISKCLAQKQMPETARTWLQVAALVLIVLLFLTKRFFPSNINRAFYSIPFNALLLFAFIGETKLSKILFGNKVMVFLGDISYEIYMIHTLIISTLLSKLGILHTIATRFSPYFTLLILIGIIIFCAAVYHTIQNYIFRKIKSKRESLK